MMNRGTALLIRQRDEAQKYLQDQAERNKELERELALVKASAQDPKLMDQYLFVTDRLLKMRARLVGLLDDSFVSTDKIRMILKADLDRARAKAIEEKGGANVEKQV